MTATSQETFLRTKVLSLSTFSKITGSLNMYEFSTGQLIVAKHHYADSLTENKKTILHFPRSIDNDDDATLCFEIPTAKQRSGTATPA